MEKINIIELIANLKFDEDRFLKLIDPAGSLSRESRQHYWQRFETVRHDLLDFYNGLEGEKSEVDYIKRNINHFFDQKAAERLKRHESDEELPSPSEDIIRPMDDLDGSESWGTNDDVKWK